MKAFVLIVATVLLPFVSIGTMTAASLLRMRDGAAAGVIPTLLTLVGGGLIIVLAFCIYQLQKMHQAKRTPSPDTGD
jgi:hypothetical protein